MPDPHDWESDDETRRRDALRHSMFNPEIPGYSLYEGRWTPWAVFGMLLAFAAMVAVAFVVLRPEPPGPINRIEADGSGCYRVTRVREGSPAIAVASLPEAFDACYVDVHEGSFFVAPIEVPSYRSSAAFLVAAPLDFDSVDSEEPFVLTDLGGGLFVVRTAADDLPSVHMGGDDGPWTCGLSDGAAPCTSP
jgi:hypothetical protein